MLMKSPQAYLIDTKVIACVCTLIIKNETYIGNSIAEILTYTCACTMYTYRGICMSAF